MEMMEKRRKRNQLKRFKTIFNIILINLKLPLIPLKLPSDPAHWLKKYPPPKQNRPMNEQAEDVSCWESVLGWKVSFSIFDKKIIFKKSKRKLNKIKNSRKN